ncbi:MAG: hypothetical protein ACKO01_01715 [Erythrobacter sp.]
MDHASDGAGWPAADKAGAVAARARRGAAPPRLPRIVPRLAPKATAGSAPRLAVVSNAFRLAEPRERAPQDWREHLASLLAWLGIEAEFVPTPPGSLLKRVAGLAPQPHRRAATAPVFAPWTAWCPTTFQNGGIPGLPQALFVASYCLEHERAFADPRGRGTDIMLLSPHPAACTAEQAHRDALPRAGVLRAMLRAALADGRERIAILANARHRAAIQRMRLADDPRLTREDACLEIISIEESLPVLMSGSAPWDAIIAMPDLRGMVFAMLTEVTGVRGPWPMLWCTRTGITRITAEALGEGAGCLPLDSAVLVHALALALRDAGRGRAALRLHEGWARLRDSGVTTARRGDDAPYVTRVAEAEFLALICRNAAASKRAQTPWRALENLQMSVLGNPTPTLRIVSSNLASS